MISAHSVTPGGPDIEFMVLAVAMFVFAIVLFFQKTAKRSVPVILIIMSMGMFAGAFALSGSPVSSAGIKVAIRSPRQGEVVPANEPFRLDIALSGARLVRNTTSDPKAGHFHVFVDEELVDMPSSKTPDVTLDAGEHTIAVEFTRADHTSFSPRIIEKVEVTAR